MSKTRAASSYLQVPALALLGILLGCGSSGAGCGMLAPLPALPAPTGFPAEQQIEGGVQVRITRLGVEKLVSIVQPLVQEQLKKPFCLPEAEQTIIGIAKVKECNMGCGSGNGCPVTVTLSKDGLLVSLPDGNMPLLGIDVSFDVSVPIRVTVNFFGTGDLQVATFQVSAPATQLHSAVRVGVDPPSGELALQLDALRLDRLELHIGGCGFVQPICDAISGYASGIAQGFAKDYILTTLRPQLDKLVQGFLPHPPGLRGALDLSAALASLHPPEGAALELNLFAGGYASAYGGGLNLGVMSGVNSDADPTTRGPGQTSDPARCVPARSTPILAAPPFNLAPLSLRHDYQLRPAGDFTGLPEPLDDKGQVQDLALGISRSFFDLLGFHLYNSGALCLFIDGGTIPQLQAATLALLAPSLQQLLDPAGGSAPVALALRPEGPLRFTVGEGSKEDPLLHARVSDLRLDLYAWIDERYARLFTMTLDADMGLNLSSASIAGTPALEPMLSGIDMRSVKVQISNTDLLSEPPEQIEKLFPALIGIAADMLTGAVKPLPLPSVQGFSLEKLRLRRVHGLEDDFVAIGGGLHLGTVKTMTLHTRARVSEVQVPPSGAIRQALLMAGRAWPMPPGTPAVVVEADAEVPPGDGRVPEFSYRIDGGAYRAWSTERRLLVREPQLLLPGRHVLTVRSRLQDDWRSEDPGPPRLEVFIPAPVGKAAAQPAGCQAAGGSGRQGAPALLVPALFLGALLLRRRDLLFALLLEACSSDEVQCTGAGCPTAAGDDIGRYSSLVFVGPHAYVSAYDASMRSLVAGRVVPPAIVSDWAVVESGGTDVGRYSSIATAGGLPAVSYYDAGGRVLRLALYAGSGWAAHTVDSGAGEDIGRYTSLSAAPDGGLQVAYLALVRAGNGGQPESQLRVARSRGPTPQSAADWTIEVVDRHSWQPPDDPKAQPLLPQAVALFVGSARRPDGALGIAYYDEVEHGLRFVEEDRAGGGWRTPRMLAGGLSMGRTTEAGAYPGLGFDGAGVAHLSYVDAGLGALRYVNAREQVQETVDDGWRDGEETTADGLPAPVHHRVGDSSSLVVAGGRIFIAYQDATAGQLRLAAKDGGLWGHKAVAGPVPGRNDAPRGSYGFFANLRPGRRGSLVLSSYGIDQHADPPRYFVETFLRDSGEPLVLQ